MPSERDKGLSVDYLCRIRAWLAVFILGLIVSGIAALPLQTELEGLLRILHTESVEPMATSTGLLPWIERVGQGVRETNRHYPFLAYGTDWLAFAHLVIAVAFIGPYRDPVRNCWVITFGLIACAGVIPLALIAGSVRHIPFAWRLIDCSFGIPHDGVLDSLVLPEVNTEAMGLFLAEVSQCHADELILMVLDGAGWHRAKYLPVPANMRLIPLPPWSPH